MGHVGQSAAEDRGGGVLDSMPFLVQGGRTDGRGWPGMLISFDGGERGGGVSLLLQWPIISCALRGMGIGRGLWDCLSELEGGRREEEEEEESKAWTGGRRRRLRGRKGEWEGMCCMVGLAVQSSYV